MLHFFFFKFPITNLENVKGLAVFQNARLRYYCTTFPNSLQVPPTVTYETLCPDREIEPWGSFSVYLDIYMHGSTNLKWCCPKTFCF